MRRNQFYTALVIGISGLVGAHAAPLTAGLSAEQLAALDPTLGGRLACRGNMAPGADLDRKLKLAGNYAASLGVGLATIQLYDGIGRSQIPAGGLDGEARQFFDQGLMLAYGFNHAASIRSFREAVYRAPDCAMCWWGIAMSSGPNINAPITEEQNAAALAALAKAAALAPAGSTEAELVAAQQRRFSPDIGADRTALDGAYADAMMALAQKYPANDDIAILAAEAAMNTSPWAYWDDVTKAPRPRIAEAVALVEKVIARNPTHSQASHLYIHLMENSADPHTAEKAADQLGASGPQALGHLVHMPSHIYFRIGRYADSMVANIKGARADEKYLATVGDDGIYRYGYYPHNVHFLLTSAQMVGNMNAVMQETARLKRILNVDAARAMPWVQAIHTAPSFALVQSASPAAILALTDEASPLGYVEAMRHYARAIAHSLTKDDAGYASEIAALDALAGRDDVQAMVGMGFPAPDLIALAGHVARGRQAMAKGRYKEAVGHFESAEAIEAKVPYNEPPYWYYPVAQTRGAALYKMGDYEGASKAFRKALFIAPNSGWALYGLSKSEGRAGHRMEALAAKAKLDEVWQGDPDWLTMDRL